MIDITLLKAVVRDISPENAGSHICVRALKLLADMAPAIVDEIETLRKENARLAREAK